MRATIDFKYYSHSNNKRKKLANRPDAMDIGSSELLTEVDLTICRPDAK